MKRLVWLMLFTIGLVCSACKKKEPAEENNEITQEPSKEPGCAKSVIHIEKLTMTLKSDDGATNLMFGDFSYPQIDNNTNEDAVNMVNEDIKRRAETEFSASFNEGATYAKEVYGENSGNMPTRLLPFVTEQSFEIMYNDHYLISYKVSGYSDFGGTHPNTYQRSYTYDLLTGELLPVTYFYTDSEEDAKELVAQTFYTVFLEEPENYYPNAGDLLTQGQFTYGFYITRDGLHFYINEYDVAPYAAGKPEVSIMFDPLVEDFRNLDRLGIESK